MKPLQRVGGKLDALDLQGFLDLAMISVCAFMSMNVFAQDGKDLPVNGGAGQTAVLPTDTKSEYWRQVLEIKTELAEYHIVPWAGHYKSTLGRIHGSAEDIEKQHIESAALSRLGCCTGAALFDLYMSPRSGMAAALSGTCGTDVVRDSINPAT